jgi:hypothetical protein
MVQRVSDPNIVNDLVDLGECQCLRSFSAHTGLRPPPRHSPMGMCLALDAEVCGSGTTGPRTVVSAVTLHGPSCCRATGLCCARSAPKVRRTFRINGPGLAGCESEAACLDCGGTVGRGGPRTRAGRFATWPHLGRNLDTGRNEPAPARLAEPNRSQNQNPSFAS